ncbi:MAG: MFS transporter, partial [Actinomycetes bacterium]
MRWTRGLRVLATTPMFRRLYLTRIVGQVGDGVITVAIGSYVFFNPENATTSGKAAVAFTTLLLPYSLVDPFAGVLLDRWRRRQVLVKANLVRALLAVALAGFVLTDRSGPDFFASGLVVLSVNRFVLSALSAALPSVVTDPGDLVLANSVSVTSGTIAATVGGLAIGAGLRIALGGAPWVDALLVVITIVLYVVAGLSALRMPRDLLGPDLTGARPATREALRSVARGIADGTWHVAHRRRARSSLVALAAHRFAYGLATISTVLLFRNYFAHSAGSASGLLGLSAAVAASALGYLLGAVATPAVGTHLPVSRWLAALLGAAALAEAVLATPFQVVPLIIGAGLLGIVAQSLTIGVSAIVQLDIDDAYRGRVFALYDIIFNVSFVLATIAAAAALP